MRKRILSAFMALCLMLTIVPVSALAADEIPETPEEGETIGRSGDETGVETGGTLACICETLCTEDSVDVDCPVCAADIGSCTGQAPEEPSENTEIEDEGTETAAPPANNSLPANEELVPLVETDPQAALSIETTLNSDGTYTLTLTGDGSDEAVVTTDHVAQWKDQIGSASISRIVATGVTISGSVFSGSTNKVTGVDVELTNCTVETQAFGVYMSSSSSFSRANAAVIDTLTMTGCTLEARAFSGTTIDRLNMTRCELPSSNNSRRQTFQYATITSINTNGIDLDQNVFGYNAAVAGVTDITVTGGTIYISAFPNATYAPNLQSITVDGAILDSNSVLSNTAAREITVKNINTIGANTISNNVNLETLTIIGSATIYSNAIQDNLALQTLVLEDIGTLQPNILYTGSRSLETITLENVRRLDSLCITGCPSLKTITGLADSKYIGGRAIHNCGNVEWVWQLEDGQTDIPAEDAKIGWNEIFQQCPAMIARMEALLADQFELADVPAADGLTVPDGWEDSKTGKENSTNIPGTQVTKAARWSNVEKTTAEVQFQFASAQAPGMDFLFVVDFSDSMTRIGNLQDSDAKFYDMQSKLLDVTGELLGTEGYNNRVAVVTFGGEMYDHTPGTFTTSDFGGSAFTNSAEAMDTYLRTLKPYYENTDYVSALEEVLDVVTNYDGERELAVIFISDGQPTWEGKTDTAIVDEDGKTVLTGTLPSDTSKRPLMQSRRKAWISLAYSSPCRIH